MSLSDTCYEALDELGDGIKRYSHWYKNNAYFSGIVNAMFALADVAVGIDQIDPIVRRDTDLSVSRVVLIYLLPNDKDSNPSQQGTIQAALVKVASINSRFAQALLTVETWLSTKEGQHVTATDFPEFKAVPTIVAMARCTPDGLAA